MTLIDQLLRAEALAYLLETARVAGLVVLAPLPWQTAPPRVRVGMTLALALVAHGAGGATQGLSSVPAIACAVLTELGVGAAMGFVVRLSVSIAETAAEVVAPMMGLSATHLFDPHAGSGTVLAVLLRHICVLAGLLVGAHRVVLGALLESFRVLPVGAVWGPSAAALPLTRLSADVLAAGVRIAIPVIAILFVAQVALAFISRAAPAMQVFNVGFAVTLAVGLAVLILLAPDMTQRLLAEWSRVGERFELVLAAFGRRP